MALSLAFQSLIDRGLQEKCWHSVPFCISDTGLMWSSAPRQAAVMLALKVLLISIGVGFSCSFCYEHPPPQRGPAPPHEQSRVWIGSNLVKFSRDRWQVLPVACTNPFQCHRLDGDCLLGEQQCGKGPEGSPGWKGLEDFPCE